MILQAKGNSIIKKTMTFYLLILFSIFPCYLIGETFYGLTFRLMLFGFLTGTVAVMYIVLLLKKKVFVRKYLCRIDICILAVLLLSIARILMQIVQNRGNYEVYFMVSVCVLAYFIFSAEGETDDFAYTRLHDWFLSACGVIYAVLLLRFLAFPQLSEPIGLLTDDVTALRAFLVLSITVSVLQYCSNRNTKKDRLYLPIAVAGFFLLFIQKDLIGILLISILFLMIPLVFLPTAGLIRRDLIMVFLFFFLLSNMPLITNYSNLLKMELHYDLKVSIYLDFFLAIAGVFIFSYWERVPKDMPLDRIVMKWLQKVFSFLLRVGGILLAAIWCLDSLEGIKDGFGIAMLTSFSQALKEAVSAADGTFGQALREYGIPGLILTVVTFAAILSRLKKRYDHSVESAMLTTVAVMFLVQSFFYKQQVVTTPVYAVLLTFALFYEKNMEESNEKFKQVETNQQMVSGGSDCSIDVWNDSKCHGTTGGNPKNRG